MLAAPVAVPPLVARPKSARRALAVKFVAEIVPLPVRMELMNNVVRAVIAQHDMQYAAPAQQ